MEMEMVVLLQELSLVLVEADMPDTGAVDHSSFVAGNFLAGNRIYVSANSKVVWWVGGQSALDMYMLLAAWSSMNVWNMVGLRRLVELWWSRRWSGWSRTTMTRRDFGFHEIQKTLLPKEEAHSS